MLAGVFYQVKALPTNQAAGQGNKSTNGQAAPTEEPPLSATKTPVTGNDASPAADKIKRSEWVQIFINAFIALIVLWQAWIYNEQRKATRIAERGYVGVDTIDLLDFEIGKRPCVQVAFMNGGRTPIWNFYSPGYLQVSDEPPEEAPPLPLPVDEPGEFVPAGAKGKCRFPFPKILEPKTERELTQGLTKLYIWGEASFEDCWKEKRTYPFFFVYDPKRGGFESYKRYSQYMKIQIGGKDAPVINQRKAN